MQQTIRKAKPLRYHEGYPADVFVNLQAAYADLTRANLTLRQRLAEVEAGRDLFLQVIESMSEALFLMDRTGRVVGVNAAACALLECEATALVGKLFSHVCGSPDIPATPWQLLALAPSGRLRHFDVDIVTAVGRLVPIRISVGLVRDQHGKITGMHAVACDISERKHAERALARQAQEQDPQPKTIPVVVLTSSAAEQDIVQAYNLHANPYITKPVDLEQFLRVIRSSEDFWLVVVMLPPAAS